MPRYTYIAKSQPNQTIQAEIEAESEQEVINKLKMMGYFPISIKSQGLVQNRQIAWRLRKSSKKDIAVFTRQLSNLVEAGINILNSLNIILMQTLNKYLKAVLSDIISKIKDGRSLSESMSAHPYLFSNLYTSMVHSGEVGGSIQQSLKRLADFLEKEEEFKNSLAAALIYPAFVFGVGTLTVIILLGFVIPKLITMFEDMGQILPLPTRILMSVSGFLRGYWWLILAALFISIFFLRRLYQSPQGRIQCDRLKLKTIILGKIILETEISRMMRTLSLLLSGGMPIVYSLDVTISVIENQVMKMQMQKFKEQISSGLSFSACLKGSKLFPAFVRDIVSVGEETGTLEKSLLRIADNYEKEVDRSLKTLTRLLEPVIILAMGLIVGFIVLSMLLPIFQINLIVK